MRIRKVNSTLSHICTLRKKNKFLFAMIYLQIWLGLLADGLFIHTFIELGINFINSEVKVSVLL